MRIFRVLLATRRTAINPEHVNALNLIEIEFYGVSEIIAGWSNYHKHLNSAPADRPMTASESKAFENTRNDLLAKLLFAIGRFLGFTMSEIDIRNGGYAPQGWLDSENRASAMQAYVLDLASGRRALPVFAFQLPPVGQVQPGQEGTPPP
jgi:hypothetical protein